jgi:hypothetical protein
LPVPTWSYRFSRHATAESVNVPQLLRTLHRAHLLGLQLEEFAVNGQRLTSKQLLLLNAWVQANGASNAARQHHFIAWERLERVLADAEAVPLVIRRLRSR